VSVQVPPRGTRGAFFPRAPGAISRFFNDLAFRFLRNRQFRGADGVLSLTTVGARSGRERHSTVAYFPDGDQAWLIVASAGGAAWHPAWLYNLARHPDQVWAQIGSRKMKVIPESLTGERRAEAWMRITTQAPGFKAYETSTDREIPVVRLTVAGP
jgi:deazaflavin-dependent oxidoreductase (nitroreductase family)